MPSYDQLSPYITGDTVPGNPVIGCARENFSDLDAFMASKRDRPGGVIAPIPTLKPMKRFPTVRPLCAAPLIAR